LSLWQLISSQSLLKKIKYESVETNMEKMYLRFFHGQVNRIILYKEIINTCSILWKVLYIFNSKILFVKSLLLIYYLRKEEGRIIWCSDWVLVPSKYVHTDTVLYSSKKFNFVYRKKRGSILFKIHITCGVDWLIIVCEMKWHIVYTSKIYITHIWYDAYINNAYASIHLV
jgi:hypothetical protein